MATDLQNLQTRRSNVLAELAAMTSTSAGGKPSYGIDGQGVYHKEYKDGLYAELKAIDELLASIGGPIEVRSN